MGECDRMKKHITDYLDHSLDPTTKKEFEHVLGESEQLKSVIKNVGRVTNLLGNLQAYHCSEEFNIRLREKILNHQKAPARDPFRRYAFTVSFAAILILAIMVFNPFSADERGDLPPLPAPSIKASPANKQVHIKSTDNMNTGSGIEVGRDIKTLDEAKAYSDSLKEKSEPKLKHVDKKEIQETRP